MTTKTGTKETVALSLIYSLTPIIISIVGLSSNMLSSGALINHIICFFVSLLMLRTIKYYFNIWGNTNIIDASKAVLGKGAAVIICAVFFLLFLIMSSSGLKLATGQISSLTFGNMSDENIKVAITLSAIALAYFGIEALTRHSYVVLFAGYIIIAVLVYASIKGWSQENLFPIFGTSVRKTLTSYVNISIFSSVAPLLFICSFLKSKKETYSCIKRTVIISFTLGFLLILIYILTVPYPIGKLYSHSLEAIFSSGSSGDILHRFEVFLIFLYTLFSIITLSFNILICEQILEGVFGFEDYRPQVLIIGIIIGSISGFGWTVREYIFSNIFLAFLSFFVPLIFSLWRQFVKRR